MSDIIKLPESAGKIATLTQKENFERGPHRTRPQNLVELLDNYAKADGEEQRAHIEAGIRKQMAELAIRHQ